MQPCLQKAGNGAQRTERVHLSQFFERDELFEKPWSCIEMHSSQRYNAGKVEACSKAYSGRIGLPELVMITTPDMQKMPISMVTAIA